MTTDGAQYGENFADDQQYSEYNQGNYSEQMEEGGENGGQENGGNGSQTVSKPGSDDER